eukprot:CAMPEP_0177597244 /NCGR_PEP_ID=MMETSP0419_2-20121207/11595_2 /TAXON_ID=582737 /ORGANISM="Tetraselmis sp., Strain GSL018" /LENGTH=71 /DNA_ID=CAMNT_0019089375 /DNA_START=431 /DNA_END=643 /DNA_ORIENTATION=-
MDEPPVVHLGHGLANLHHEARRLLRGELVGPDGVFHAAALHKLHVDGVRLVLDEVHHGRPDPHFPRPQHAP